MKYLVGLMMSVVGIFGFGGVVMGQYVPTQQDQAIVASLELKFEQLLASDSDSFEMIAVFLGKKKEEFTIGSRKFRLADVLLTSMERVMVNRVNDSLGELFGGGMVVSPTKQLHTRPATVPTVAPAVVPSREPLRISDTNKEILMQYMPVDMQSKEILMLEFSDLQCPFCKRFHDSGVLEEIDDLYDEVGYMTLAYPLSFHPLAEPGAAMSMCVYRDSGGDAYTTYIHEMFAAGLTRESDIIAGLDVLGYDDEIRASVENCYESQETFADVAAQVSLGRALGVTGTPSTVVLDTATGYYIKTSGAVPRDPIEERVKQMLRDDRELIAPAVRSTPPSSAPVIQRLDTADHMTFLASAYIDGNVDAPVSVIEFSDVECPFCQRHTNNGTLDQVHETYGDEVHIIYAHFPLGFHMHAQKAGEALECVGEMGGSDLFFEFKKNVYKAGRNASRAIVFGVAEDMGIDIDMLGECVDAGTYAQKVKDQMAYGRSLGVTGTPGNIVVNNVTGEYVKISGAVPASSFDSVIQDFLAK